MNYIKILCLCGLSLRCMVANGMEQHDEPIASKHTVYIYNKSDYAVRISVGTHYPSFIALDPGQMMSFPIDKVQTIIASSYGKLSHFSGKVAELNIAALLKDNKNYKPSDLVVNITYEKGKSSSSLWNFACYLFTQGKWALSLESTDSNQFEVITNKSDDFFEKLSKKIIEASKSIPEQVGKDAALIWSMFPRAATKIIEKKPVYPFNILGLDIGGFVASDDQLRNWADLLYKSLVKKFPKIDNQAIWNAANMLITDAMESLRMGNYYAQRQPTYLITLLHRSEAVEVKEDPLPIELISQLKQQVKDEPSLALLEKLEKVAQKKVLTSQSEVPPPPPLPMPEDNVKMSKLYKANVVTRFLDELKNRKMEEQTLLDKVVLRVFDLINELKVDSQATIFLKYAALDKLSSVKEHKHGISQLNQISKFMTFSMLQMVQNDVNPAYALQEWLLRLAKVEQSKAYEYAQLKADKLQKLVKEEDKTRDYQALLMSHLQEQIVKFQEPQEK